MQRETRKRKLVIAIDGPAGSGKSTTARLVAKRLGLLHIDTGAMYRAITLKVLKTGVNPDNEDAVASLMDSTTIELQGEDSSLRVLLDGKDVTRRIRDSDVTRCVSTVSRHRRVRKAMVKQQRALGASEGVVLEGRDIGTVVFPDADIKIFLVASLEARARRRQKELREKGVDTKLETLMREIEERDRMDSTREESPLKKSLDGIELDTSDLTIEQEVEFVIEKARKILESLHRS
jgi:cytidylate kinase